MDTENIFETDKSREAEMDDFIKEMKTPKEEIEESGVVFDEEEDLEESEEPKEDDASDAQSMDYTSEHLMTAQFMIGQIDSLVAFGCSIYSGEIADRYRKYKSKPPADNYEVEILAALVKKYQMKMSLEMMFITAIIMAYTPVVTMAVSDRKKNRKKEEADKQKAESPSPQRPEKAAVKPLE